MRRSKPQALNPLPSWLESLGKGITHVMIRLLCREIAKEVAELVVHAVKLICGTG